MNRLQQAIQAFRDFMGVSPVISPIPNQTPPPPQAVIQQPAQVVQAPLPQRESMEQATKRLIAEQLAKTPGMLVSGLQSSVNVSPPVDLINRFNTTLAYNRNNIKVPYEESVRYSTNYGKEGANALKFAAIMSLLRPFARNPDNLSNSERLTRLSTGRGWERSMQPGKEM